MPTKVFIEIESISSFDCVVAINIPLNLFLVIVNLEFSYQRDFFFMNLIKERNYIFVSPNENKKLKLNEWMSVGYFNLYSDQICAVMFAMSNDVRTNGWKNWFSCFVIKSNTIARAQCKTSFFLKCYPHEWNCILVDVFWYSVYLSLFVFKNQKHLSDASLEWSMTAFNGHDYVCYFVPIPQIGFLKQTIPQKFISLHAFKNNNLRIIGWIVIIWYIIVT